MYIYSIYFVPISSRLDRCNLDAAVISQPDIYTIMHERRIEPLVREYSNGRWGTQMIHNTVDWDIAIIRYDVPVPPNTGQPEYRQHSRDSAAAIWFSRSFRWLHGTVSHNKRSTSLPYPFMLESRTGFIRRSVDAGFVTGAPSYYIQPLLGSSVERLHSSACRWRRPCNKYFPRLQCTTLPTHEDGTFLP